MSEPLLSCPALISRPRDLRRLRARAVSFTVAAVWFAGCVGGLLLFEILWAESSLPPHAVTVPLIFRPPPPSLRPSLPGGGGGPKAAVPPAPQKAPDRPVVVPLTPPLSDDELPPEPPPENNADIGAADGTGLDGIPGGDEMGGCEGCNGTGDGGPGDGPGGPGGNGLGDFLAENTPGLEPPIVIPSTRIHPDYPEIARKAKVVGSVLLLIVIDQGGRVGSIEVLDAPDSRFGFDLAAIEAVKRWRYRPARLGGRPVAVQASVRVEFTLAR
jgi:protein TonB